ncbi:MAG: hypothetical protein HW378_3679, partial [Anaerolineales bacterium]|nr:hypothetical protein [Anaerolineales bacterium]
MRSPLALISAAALLLLSLWGSSATYASPPLVPGPGYLDFSYTGVT